MRHYNRVIVFATSLLVLVSACKTKQKALAAQEDKTTTSTTTTKDSKPLFTVANSAFTYLTAKAELSVKQSNSNGTTNAVTNIRIRKDSVIWISASVLGLEAGRVLFTRDSIKVLNRLKGIAYLRDYRYVSELLGTEVDFYTLQALLLGDIPPRLALISRDKIIYDKLFAIFPLELPEQIQKAYVIVSTKKLSRFEQESIEAKQHAIATYSNFGSFGANTLPQNLNFVISQDKITTTTDVTYSKIDFPEKTEFPFTIPTKYKKM